MIAEVSITYILYHINNWRIISCWHRHMASALTAILTFKAYNLWIWKLIIVFTAARLQIHANFHEFFKIVLKLKKQHEFTKMKQSTHYKQHSQPAKITKIRSKYSKIWFTALVAQEKYGCKYWKYQSFIAHYKHIVISILNLFSFPKF
jgi:hypothetical protein